MVVTTNEASSDLTAGIPFDPDVYSGIDEFLVSAQAKPAGSAWLVVGFSKSATGKLARE